MTFKMIYFIFFQTLSFYYFPNHVHSFLCLQFRLDRLQQIHIIPDVMHYS